ncbi:DNA recombination protein RmuC [Patescibacteria group bacterium]|nr:DNA recombination protein RmuC [Patescibacteria group bacterium]MBU1473103.1 DNA recombination protein RmuC [Patescibacteria group bacterium]
MQVDFIILAIALIAGFVFLAWLVKRELSKLSEKKEDTTLTEWLKSMQSSIESTNKALNEAMRGQTSDVAKLLQSNTKQLNERLDTAARVIGDLKKNLGEMSEVGRGIKSLQEFLQSPKLRGNIGEQVLTDMIGQTFPKNSFHLQYSFKSGAKVDAVLKTDAGLLCIDSKFPMENFTAMHKGETETDRSRAKKEFLSDVKKHVHDISKKYILPEEGTMDFALMYIPSEAVYYEIANLNDLMEYTRKMRVYPVSPNTLYAHLQVLLLSFQGKDLEQKSRQVFQLLRAIQKDYGKVEENLGVMGRHVNNAYNSMNTVSSSFNLLGQKLSQTQTLETIEEAKEQLTLKP